MTYWEIDRVADEAREHGNAARIAYLKDRVPFEQYARYLLVRTAVMLLLGAALVGTAGVVGWVIARGPR